MQIAQNLFKLCPFRTRIGNSRGQHTIARKAGWESVIGLEVHAQISTKSKLFSPASVSFGGSVNTQVAFLDASIPGTLPVLNRASVEAGVLTALALSCQLNKVSTFDRKHYFYADLPAGYQITQQRNPLATKGQFEFLVKYTGVVPYYHTCKIHQLQLEQDSGKSLHDEELQRSLIDLNRAGVGLMEIVFEPDLRDGEEAACLVKELIVALDAIGTCSGKMEEGALRVDANISVNRTGEPLGVRTEVKNLSSLRSISNSVEFEIKRQIDVLESGGTVVNETLSYDAVTKKTMPMRDKEMKQDYRFMPEPNLPPIRLCDNPDGDVDTSLINIAPLRKKLETELPNTIRKRLMDKYGLNLDVTNQMMNCEGCYDYFLAVMSHNPNCSAQKVASLVFAPIYALYHKEYTPLTNCPINPKDAGDIASAWESGRINQATIILIVKLLEAKDKRTLDQILQDGLALNSDDNLIEKICLEVMEKNPEIVQKYRRVTPENDKKRDRVRRKLMDDVKKAGGETINMKRAVEIMKRLLIQ